MFDELSLRPELFNNPMIKRQLAALRVLGHICSKSDRFQVFHLLRGPAIAISNFYLLAAQIASVWINRGKFGKMILPLASFIVFLNIVTKMVTFYPYRKCYVKLIEDIERNVKKVLETNIKQEIEIYEKYAKGIERLSAVFFSPLLMAAILNGADAMYFVVTSYKELIHPSPNSTIVLRPFYEMYPFLVFTNNFTVVYLYPLFTMFAAITALFAFNSFHTSLMRYVAFRCDIVNYKSENMKEYIDLKLRSHRLVGRPGKHNFDSVCKSVFLSCIEDIVEIRSFSKMLEDVTRGVVFVESVTVAGLLCLLLYQATKDNLMALGIYVFWALSMLGTLWLYYWHANEISLKSDKFCESLYCSMWCEFPVELQKDVLIFMKGCIKPIEMKAMLFEMNTGTLLLILKTSYSYFTLLKNLTD